MYVYNVHVEVFLTVHIAPVLTVFKFLCCLPQNSSITDSPKPAHVESTKLDSKHLKSKKQSSDAKSPDNKGTSGGGILALLQSTTSEHGQHLYDHHCDICTGKMKPPTLSTSPPPSPDSRMHEDAHTTEHTLVTCCLDTVYSSSMCGLYTCFTCT